MNLEELQTARDRERQTDKLQQLRESFYADAAEFIQQLRAERDRAADRAADPFDSPEVNRLTDRIDTAEQSVEAIYEKRVGKIVKAASFAAADLPAEADGMTAEEQDLFETLVSEIKGNRQRVLDQLAGERSDAVDESSQSPPNGGDSGVSAADLMGEGDSADESASADGSDSPAAEDPTAVAPEPGVAEAEAAPIPPDVAPPAAVGQEDVPDENASDDENDSPDSGESGEDGDDALRNDGGGAVASGRATGGEDAPAAPATGDEKQPSVERRTVRVTDQVEAFVGTDERDYDLEPDDVVTLPAANADLLVERDVAEDL